MIPRLSTLFVALVALALAAPAVLGHAELEETDPVEGGTISTPYTVTGRFSEPLVGNSGVVIRNSAGEEVAGASIADSDDPSVLSVDLPDLPAGDYVARWTATTDDGHTERFSSTFVVIGTATPEPTSAPTAAPLPSATPGPVEPTTPSNSNDLLIALLLAGAAVAGVLGYLFLRNRR